MNANEKIFAARTAESAGNFRALSFTPSPRHPLTPSSPRRRAFTFLEVLFAVIIIGVGMIMVAGMFPVAIEQTQANAADAAGVAVGRDALRYLQTVASTYVPPALSGSALPLLPVTTSNGFYSSPAQYPVMPLPNELINIATANGNTTYAQSNLFPTIAAVTNTTFIHNPNAIALGGNQTLTGDNRYGWIGFYRRDTIPLPSNINYFVPAPYAQVWIITAQSTAEGQPPFNSATAVQPATNSPAVQSQNIQSVTFAYTSTYGSIVQIQKGATSAAPNAFVLCLLRPLANGAFDSFITGQVFRLGSVLGSDANGDTIWNLAPGYDLSSSNPPLTAITYALPNDLSTTAGALPSTAFILGSPWIPNPTPSAGNAGQFIGPAQDISVVTGFVRVSN